MTHNVRNLPKFVYVLRLEGDNYYIGITTDIESRIAVHREGKGGLWTKLHPPIEKIDEYDNGSTELENEITLKYIEMHGWEKVRGASFTNPVQKNPQAGIERMKREHQKYISKPKLTRTEYIKREPEPKKLSKEDRKLERKLLKLEMECREPIRMREEGVYKIEKFIRTTEIENEVWGGSRIIN
nr:hypothetical protein K-LCC10_0002 [Kaumoebavirus]